MANNNNPESDRSNILRFQPPVTKSDGAGCPELTSPATPDPMAQEGLRLFKAYFAIEDAVVRASLIGLMEHIYGLQRSERKRDERQLAPASKRITPRGRARSAPTAMRGPKRPSPPRRSPE